MIYAGKATALARRSDSALVHTAMGGLRKAIAKTSLDTLQVIIVILSLETKWLVRNATGGTLSNPTSSLPWSRTRSCGQASRPVLMLNGRLFWTYLSRAVNCQPGIRPRNP